MNNVATIQTIVNEHRDKMPASTAQEITEQCRNFFVKKRTNLKVNVTWVHIVYNVNFYDSDYDDPYVVTKAVHQTQTLFVEGLDERPDDLRGATEEILNRGQGFTSWLKRPMPIVWGTNHTDAVRPNRLCFVNSVERLDKAPDEPVATKPVAAPKKRSRPKAKSEEETEGGGSGEEDAPKRKEEEEDCVSKIQSIVDEQRERLPTGAATAIMKECQQAFEEQPKLYKVDVSWVHIQPFTSPNEEDCTEPLVTIRFMHQRQTIFAEGVGPRTSVGYAPELLHRGQVPKSWLDCQKPIVFGTENGSSFTSDTLCLVHSMELAEPSAPSSAPNKRGRSEE